jgi:WD40 repeat protein
MFGTCGFDSKIRFYTVKNIKLENKMANFRYCEKGKVSIILLYEFDQHFGDIYSLDIKMDDSNIKVVSGGSDLKVRLWTPSTNNNQSFNGHEDTILSVSFGWSLPLIASSSMDKTVRIWSTVSNECQNVISVFTCIMKKVEFFLDNMLIVAGFDGVISGKENN